MKIITETNALMQQHLDAREGMTNHFNKEMEIIINSNQHLDKYYIIGKVKTQRRGDKHLVKPFLQAF